MHLVNFTYQGREYSGYIASSTIKEPYFHWLFFTDQSLTDLVGDDCVAFRQMAGGPLEHFNRIPLKHQELVKIAELHVKNYLKLK
jgi:hypothetical protein